MYMSYVAHVVPLPLQFLSDVLFELVHFLTKSERVLGGGIAYARRLLLLINKSY